LADRAGYAPQQHIAVAHTHVDLTSKVMEEEIRRLAAKPPELMKEPGTNGWPARRQRPAALGLTPGQVGMVIRDLGSKGARAGWAKIHDAVKRSEKARYAVLCRHYGTRRGRKGVSKAKLRLRVRLVAAVAPAAE
jgi:hypothetical protein